MYKNYFPLLTILLLATLIVGSFAVYRSFFTPRQVIPQNPQVLSAKIKKASPSPTPSPKPSPMPTISLSIDSPTENASVSSSLLPISGKTATQAAVVVNEKKVLTESDGSFKTSIRLAKGANLVVIQASESGRTSVWQTVVTYAP